MATLYPFLKPVDSSMFSRAGFDEDTWRLVYEFKSTREIKAYLHCSPEVAEDALSASEFGGSIGRWWNAKVKGNPQWEFETLPPDEQPKSQDKTTDAALGTLDEDIKLVEPGWDGEKIVPDPEVDRVDFYSQHPDGSHTKIEGGLDFGAKAFDPQTGHWPSDAVNEDGTVKEGAIAAMSTLPPSGELLGAWTAPESAAEALDLLAERDGEIKAIIKANTDTGQQALTVKIDSQESRVKASETLDRLVSKSDKTKSALDPFRKVLYDAYQEAGALVKAGLDPLDNGVKFVKNAIITWDRAAEAERQRKIREDNERRDAEAKRLQEEESNRLKLAEVSDALESGNEQQAQTLFDTPLQVPRPYVAPVYIPPSAPKIEGQSTSTKWKVDEDVIEDDQAYVASIVMLVRAVNAGSYDIQQAAALLKWDLPAVNKLASALGSAFNVPGLSVKEAGSLSVRRKRK